MTNVPVLSPSAPSSSCRPWQAHYLELLPAIGRHARYCFRHWRRQAREEAVAEVIASSLVACQRLAMAGRLDLAYASPLARYGVLRYLAGRRVGASCGATDVLASQCQRRQGFAVEDLELVSDGLPDHRQVTPAARAATRLDFTLWLQSLAARDRALVELLATGETTQAAARTFGISAGRVSQLRSQYRRSWREFIGETAAPLASRARNNG
jgi:hypothetical protein